MTDPSWLGAAIVIAGFGASLVLIVSGGLRLWRASSQFGKRLARYEDLPLHREVASTVARLERLDARLNEMPGLIQRAQNLYDVVQKSRRQVQLVVSSVNFAAQLIRAVVEGPGRNRNRTNPAPPTSDGRIRES